MYNQPNTRIMKSTLLTQVLVAMLTAGVAQAQIQLSPRWGQRVASAPNLNVEVFSGCSNASGDTIFVTGRTAGSGTTSLNGINVGPGFNLGFAGAYNSQTGVGVWASPATFSGDRFFTSAYLPGRLVVGGDVATSLTMKLITFNLTSNTSTVLVPGAGPAVSARITASTALSNGKILFAGNKDAGTIVFGGKTIGPEGGLFTGIFDPYTNSVDTMRLAVANATGSINVVKIRPNGNILLAGTYSGSTISVDFDPGPGTVLELANTGSGSSNRAFIQELSSTFAYVNRFNFGDLASTAGARINTIDLLTNGTLIIGGTAAGNVDFDGPGAPVVNFGQTANTEMGFLASYSTTLGLNWVKRYPVTGSFALTEITGVAVTEVQNTYLHVFGSWFANAQLSLPGDSTVTSATSADLFLHTYTSNGTLVASRKVFGPGQNRSVAMFRNNTNLYLLGRFQNAVNINFSGAPAYPLTANGTGFDGFGTSYAVNCNPFITTQPQALIQSCLGSEARFAVRTLDTTGYTYQWKRNGVNLTNSSTIVGATSQTLRVRLLTSTDTGLYSCDVTNSCGTTVSSEGRLLINTVTGNDYYNSILAYIPYTGTTGAGVGSATVTNPGPATFTNDRFGNPNQALTLGTHNITGVPLPSGAAAFSAMAWIRINNVTTSNHEIYRFNNVSGGGNILRLDYNGSASNFRLVHNFGGTNSLFTTATLIPANTWTHVAVTYDGGTRRLYINGNLVTQDGFAATVPVSTTVNVVSNFPGAIDDFHLYSRSLSQDEIRVFSQIPGFDSIPSPVQTTCNQSPVTFSTSIQSLSIPAITWTRSGAIIPGATGTSLTITPTQPADFTNYRVRYSSGCIQVNSGPIRLDSGVQINLTPITTRHFHFNNGNVLNQVPNSPDPGILGGTGTLNQVNDRFGLANGAVNFAGTNRFINIGTIGTNGVQAGAFSLWFKTNAGTQIILGSSSSANFGTGVPTNRAANIYLDNTGRIRAQLWAGSLLTMQSPSPVNDNQWHHVVLSYGNNSQSMYLDGVLINTIALGNNIPLFYAIGTGYGVGWPGLPNTGWNPYDDQLDDFRTFSRALTFAEVQELYTVGEINRITNQSVCGSNNITLNVQTRGFGNGTSFNWVLANQNLTVGSSATTTGLSTLSYSKPNATSADYGDYVLRSINGCLVRSSFPTNVQPTQITQINTPLIDSLRICSNTDTISLSVGAIGSDLAYSWFRDNNTLPIFTGPSISITNPLVSNSGIYKVIVTGLCGSDSSFSVVNVTQRPFSPTTNLGQSFTPYCDSIEVTAGNIATGNTVQWLIDNQLVVGNQNPKWFNVSGILNVRQISPEGCIGTNSANRIIDKVQVTKPVITRSGDDLSVQNFYNNYTWFLNGNVINGANTNTLTMTATGTYTASGSINQGFVTCSSLSDPLVVTALGLEPMLEKESIAIYPNPFNNSLNVSIPTITEGKLTIYLIDLSGKKVISIEHDRLSSLDVIEINTEGLAPGMYILSIGNSTNVIYQKIEKQP
jgi:hypothetical protein